METQVCKQCGRELPVEQFSKIGNRGGGTTSLHICKECMQGRQKEGRQKRKERMAQLEIKRTQDIRNMRLSDFTPRELMVELKRRGYKFTAEITVTNVIDSDNL